MDNTFLIDTILSEWALRSPSGLCSENLSEEDLECLLETVQDLAFDVIKDPSNFVNEISVIAEKGKHPERQAYNKNGLLVTFPTPEYKARAIAKGTHFEKNPKVNQTNLFGGGQQAPQGSAPVDSAAASTSKSNMDSGQSELPQSDSGQPQTEPAKKEQPQPGMPGGDVPKAPSGGQLSSGGSSELPAQGQLAVEPPLQPTSPKVSPAPSTPIPPPVQKTPEEIAAEKQVIKQMMNTDDTLPTVPGVGGSGMAENLKEQLGQLTKIAIEMKLNEAVKFLSNHL